MSYGEQFGTYIGGFSEYNADPYQLSREDMPDVSSLFFTPAKWSVYANITRSLWHGSRALNITRSLSQPFSVAGLEHRYRARTLRGISRDLLNLTSPARMRAEKAAQRQTNFIGNMFHSTASVQQKVDATPSWFSRFIRPESQKGYDDFLTTMKPGLVDKYLLRPSHLQDVIGKIAPGLSSTMTKNELATSFLKNMYAGEIRSAAASRTTLPRDLQTISRYTRAQKQHVVTLSDIVTGKVGKGDTRPQQVFDALFGDTGVFAYGEGNQRKPFRLWHSRRTGIGFSPSRKAMQFAQRNEAMIDMAKSIGVTSEQIAAGQHVFDRYNMHIEKRITQARRMKFAAGGMLALPIAADMLRGGMRALAEIPARTASTMRALTRPEFGSGEVVLSSRMASERQRAMEAIQHSHLNARYLLGSEAQLYH